MDLYIGENIKKLRREKGITQERLAEYLNISTQAVSKWERGETLPDITLVIPLASYFGVSTDALLGLDEAKNKAKAEEMLAEYRRLAWQECKWADAAAVIGEAHREFPNNWEITHRYMWNLAGEDADNDPALLLEHKDELSGLCEKILEECTVDSIRLGAVNMQAKIAHAAGDTEKALEILEALPSFYNARPQVTEQLFAKDTPEFMRRLHCNIFELASFTANKILKEIWFADESLDSKLGKSQKLAAYVQTILDDTGYTPAYKILGEIYGDMAKYCAWDCRYEEAVRYLGENLRCYDRFDRMIADNEAVAGVPDGVVRHLLDGWYYNRSLVETVLTWYRNNPRCKELSTRGDFRALCAQFGKTE